MTTRRGVFLLLLLLAAMSVQAQVEETVDSTEMAAATDTVTTSTTTTSFSSNISLAPTHQPPAPAWIHLVRMSAVAGPVAFLLLAWAVGGFVHYRLVRAEQARFPVVRGSRAPQTTPMLISSLLFFVPVVLFVFFEIRSRREFRLGIPGVIDEWNPVNERAWMTLVVCLVLALIPWLLARRADTVA